MFAPFAEAEQLSRRAHHTFLSCLKGLPAIREKPICGSISFDAYLGTAEGARRLQVGRAGIAKAAATAKLAYAGGARFNRNNAAATLQSCLRTVGWAWCLQYARQLCSRALHPQRVTCTHAIHTLTRCERVAGADARGSSDVMEGSELAAKAALLVSDEYAVVATWARAERLAGACHMQRVSAADLERKLRFLRQHGWNTARLNSDMLCRRLCLVVGRALFAEKHRCAALGCYMLMHKSMCQFSHAMSCAR